MEGLRRGHVGFVLNLRIKSLALAIQFVGSTLDPGIGDVGDDLPGA
jgi:hypothetical protein